MHESLLKKEIKHDTLSFNLPGLVWCNHQDKMQKGVADTEIVYNGITTWVEWKEAIGKSQNVLMRNQFGKHFSLQLDFLQKRVKAGINAYVGVFVNRNWLYMIPAIDIQYESKLIDCSNFKIRYIYINRMPSKKWNILCCLTNNHGVHEKQINEIIYNPDGKFIVVGSTGSLQPLRKWEDREER